MAKSKKNRKAVGQNRLKVKSLKSGKINPFEIRVTRQKHNILGKKTKHDKGTPGISRSKAIQKRNATLLEEYLQRHKTNKFLDKRLGENDPTMSVEDKMMQRFKFERQKTHEKSSVYNLAEEEDLTHYGQSLSEIEKFEHETSDVDDDEDDRLRAKEMVEENFGGLFRKKTEEDQPKSHQEVMMEIIAKSKKEKYDRQKEKETTNDMTEKLDENWKEVSLLLAGMKSMKDSEDEKPRKKPDDYDIAVRELIFDMKAKATDRLKTPEELAKDEKERLEKLEADRQKRMMGLTEDEKKPKHQSADDLNDDFEIFVENRMMLSYKDGKPLNNDFFSAAKKAVSSEDGEEEGDDDEEDGSAKEDGLVEEDVGNDGEGEIEEMEVEDANEDAESSEEDEDDLKSDEESDSDGTAETAKEVVQGEGSAETKSSEKAKIMKTAKEELPYTFTAPSSYEELTSLLSHHTTSNQLTVIERLRKCHHPSLAEGNKDKLQSLLTFLLEYFISVADAEALDMELLNGLTRSIYELSKLSHHHTGTVFQEKVVEKYQEFNSVCEEKGYGAYPPASFFLYLKLLSVVFPTSDFRHCVVTPAMLLMGQMLSHCRVRTLRDVGCGLFLCNLSLQYVHLSKRVIPEVLNFLHGLLFLAMTKEPKKLYPVCLPFKPVGKYINLLHLTEARTSEKSSTSETFKLDDILLFKDDSHLDCDQFRIWTITLTLKLLSEFGYLYEEHASAPELFEPIAKIMDSNLLRMENYPAKTKEIYEQLKDEMTCIKASPRKALQREKKRPIPLKMFEPRIEENYDPTRKKHSTGDKELDQKKKLRYKYRKEMKGAMREIKKDTQFIARQKLKEQMERDAVRKQKVKEIEHMLASQEGDYNALQRKKGKVKKF